MLEEDMGVGTKSRRRSRRGPNRQRGSSRGKVAGGRGRGICVARHSAGPPAALESGDSFADRSLPGMVR